MTFHQNCLIFPAFLIKLIWKRYFARSISIFEANIDPTKYSNTGTIFQEFFTKFYFAKNCVFYILCWKAISLNHWNIQSNNRHCSLYEFEILIDMWYEETVFIRVKFKKEISSTCWKFLFLLNFMAQIYFSAAILPESRWKMLLSEINRVLLIIVVGNRDYE